MVAQPASGRGVSFVVPGGILVYVVMQVVITKLWLRNNRNKPSLRQFSRWSRNGALVWARQFS